jgi:hypothetical protein
MFDTFQSTIMKLDKKVANSILFQCPWHFIIFVTPPMSTYGRLPSRQHYNNRHLAEFEDALSLRCISRLWGGSYLPLYTLKSY